MKNYRLVSLLALISTFVLMLIVSGSAGCKKEMAVDDTIVDKPLADDAGGPTTVFDKKKAAEAGGPTDVFDQIEVSGTTTPGGTGTPAGEQQTTVEGLSFRADVNVTSRITRHRISTREAKRYREKHIDGQLGQLNFCKLESGPTYEFLGTPRTFPPSSRFPRRTGEHTNCDYSLDESDILPDAIQWRDIGYLDEAMIEHVKDQIAPLGMTPTAPGFPSGVLLSWDDITDVDLSVKGEEIGEYVFLIGNTYSPYGDSNTLLQRSYGFMAVVGNDLNISQAKVVTPTQVYTHTKPGFVESDFRAMAAFYLPVHKNSICAAGSVIEEGDPRRKILVQCNMVSLANGDFDRKNQYRQIGHSGSKRHAHADAIAHFKSDNNHYLVVGGSASFDDARQSAQHEIFTTPILILLKHNATGYIGKVADIRLEEDVHGGVNDVAIVGNYAFAVGWGEDPDTGKMGAALWIVDLSDKNDIKKVYLSNKSDTEEVNSELTFGGIPSIAHTVQALELPTAAGKNRQFYVAIGGGKGEGTRQKMRVWQFVLDAAGGKFSKTSLVEFRDPPRKGYIHARYIADLKVDPQTLALYALVRQRDGNSILARIVTRNNVPELDGSFAEGGDPIQIGCNDVSRMQSMAMFENGDILVVGKCSANVQKKKLGLMRVFELR